MNKKGRTMKQHTREKMKDPAFKKAWKALDSESIVKQMDVLNLQPVVLDDIDGYLNAKRKTHKKR